MEEEEDELVCGIRCLKREVQGLTEAIETLHLRRGSLLTYSQEETRKVTSLTISISPVWKWLLGRDRED